MDFSRVKIDKGTVLLLPVPNQENPNVFTDRPVIVLNDDSKTLKVLVCPVSKQLHQNTRYFHTIPIKSQFVDFI